MTQELLSKISKCTLCQSQLTLGARPVVQFDSKARILIAGQAPGLKVHQTGIPFDDASGDRLRSWLGVDKETFYDPTKFAILPMAFCYPGSHKAGSGKSGDLPPPKLCAGTWRAELLSQLPNLKLVIVLGKYAQAYHLPETKNLSLTELVKTWKDHQPISSIPHIPLPHPSPRNNIWLKNNPWFEEEVLAELAERVAGFLPS